jgi:hypothetical protein
VAWLRTTATVQWSPYAAGERDEMLMRARRGEMSPEQVEARARDNDQLPFAVVPDDKGFAAMLGPYWTLSLV